jgi:hypothetical protein
MPNSGTIGTGSFPGVKRPERGADHLPLVVLRSRNSRAILIPPSLGLWVCYGVPLTFTPLKVRRRDFKEG